MDEQIYTIIAKSLAGEADPAEMEELQRWLEANPQNQKELEELADAWQQSDKLFESWPQCNVAAAWDKISGRICDPQIRPLKKTYQLPAWLRYTIPAAAVLLIGFFVVRTISAGKPATVFASNANTEIVLPDDSHVLLRKGSSLTYPKHFNANERHVVLNGEAFFEVTHNAEHPFTIDAGSADVKVLGTSFSVKCNDQEAKVVVATGRVQLTGHNEAHDAVVLTPGQKGTFNSAGVSKDTTNSSNELYWKTGVLSFEQEPLASVVKKMTAATDTAIELDPSLPVNLREQSVTISFNNQPVEAMLSELCLIAQCKWAKQKNTYIITAK
ncbi:FecR domain-containing protein [Chitinophagaceae bacterium MMS25-I14]